MSEREDDSRLSHFLLGLGLGAALGVLFAPKPGVETRRMIRDRAEEGADYVKRRAEESADYMKRRGEELRESAAETLERGKQTLERRKENIVAAVDAGRQAYRDSLQSDSD